MRSEEACLRKEVPMTFPRVSLRTDEPSRVMRSYSRKQGAKEPGQVWI